MHVDPWPGFKAGALNLVLRQYTDERAEIIGLIDADDFVVPHYLKEIAPLLLRPAIGFLQTFEGNRDYQGSPYYTACVDSYQAFYLTVMSSRNERNTVPFVGTMGLFRRSALEPAGGWNEWCICEDTEASLRVTQGRLVRPVHPPPLRPGCGPPTSRDADPAAPLVLRGHADPSAALESLMPWDHSPDNRLSSQQRRYYLMASLGWMRDLLMVLFTIALFATTALLLSGSHFWVLPIAGGVSLLGISLIAVALVSMLLVMRQWTNMSRRCGALREPHHQPEHPVGPSRSPASKGWRGERASSSTAPHPPRRQEPEGGAPGARCPLVGVWEMARPQGCSLCGLLLASRQSTSCSSSSSTVQGARSRRPRRRLLDARAQMAPAADARASLSSNRHAGRSVGGDRSSGRVSCRQCWRWSEPSSPHRSPPRVGCWPVELHFSRVETAAQIDAPPAGAPASRSTLLVEVMGAPGGGWLEVTADGVVWAGGGANYFGDLQHRPDAPPIVVSNIVEIRPTQDGFGYWLVGSDGSVYCFGDAPYLGSLSGLGVHVSDVVGLIPFSSGDGYELVGAFEQVWKFGQGTP